MSLKNNYEIIGFLDVSTIDVLLKEDLVTITSLLGDLLVKGLKLYDQTQPIKDSVITAKQINILKQLTKGYTEQAVAKELGLSISTIKYHKRQIYRELQVNCICEAIAKAVKYGLIDV